MILVRTSCALALVIGLLGALPGSQTLLPAASAASAVPADRCRGLDPNLVRGVCLRYQARSGTAYTWIGTYRASNGRVFFCIDFLYDSRIAGRPTITSTGRLVNQLGQPVGDAEVAALNYIISTWAAGGSTGSDARDAAVALIIREVMSDGVRPDGTVVYPRGLVVGQRVRPPIGGLSAPVMDLAQSMWSEASRYRGGYRLELSTAQTGTFELGTSRAYQVSVVSSAGYRVPGVPVRFSCSGPVTCPSTIRTRTAPVTWELTPREVGAVVVRAQAQGPAADGRLYRVGGWKPHGGATAADRGIQRGWIAERSPMTAQVTVAAVIVKGTPQVRTVASHHVAQPGTPLHDVVTVSDLPAGYRQQVRADLYGPFATRPAATACTPAALFGTVSFVLERNGEHRTPSLIPDRPGYYVWTETLPGDARTNPLTTPCGVVEETTQVLARTPAIATRASSQRAVVGRSIFDTVVLSGLGASDRVVVRWALHGPAAPRGGSCADLDWSGVSIADRGQLAVQGSGRFVTTPSRVRLAGCYTYSAVVDASATTVSVTSPPGLVSETALVTRPRIPYVPQIPSGPSSSGKPGVRR